ncbi:MAG: 4-alpha-glucanotransferase [Acidobacteriota bacterium]|nr:MAG: 4-alpha-glucanotransferase [Acidobacteriota bacterium]
MNDAERACLSELAGLYGLETEFYDGLGIRRTPPPEAILAVLKSLGVPLRDIEDVCPVLEDRRRERLDRVIEPVLISWDGKSLPMTVTAPEPTSGSIRVDLELESGEELRQALPWTNGQLQDQFDLDGTTFQRRTFHLEWEIPPGYHDVWLEIGPIQRRSTLISTYPKAFSDPTSQSLWGLFLPLYALHSKRSWGAGDISDLERLMTWTGERGGRFVGVLPMFASFLESPCDPSPYTPVSRLFWNELFIDPRRCRNWDHCPQVHDLLGNDAFQAALEQQRQLPLVDYREQIRLKRTALEKLAEDFFSTGGALSESYNDYLRSHPAVLRYAGFRAVQEKLGKRWSEWPDYLKNGHLDPQIYDRRAVEYHLFCQWTAHEQIAHLLRSGEKTGVGLYMDLPLGVHPDGFDVWENQDIFAHDISGGAPPDGFFTAGQDWGFRPLLPEASRQTGHRYLRSILKFLLGSANLLRVDHAMGFQRLYWVPRGFGAENGVYVRYPMEELFATLVLESQRRRCEIVGEDLGTVDPALRHQMTEHAINRMYVGLFETALHQDPPLRPVPSGMVASINTHDTPSFAAFWNGLDIEDRQQMGLLDEAGVAAEQEGRRQLREALLRYFQLEELPTPEETERAVLQAWTAQLGRSEAKYVLVNLEDLWLETKPQNVPGTSFERPNWKRKARLSQEAFESDMIVKQILEELNRLRIEKNEAKSFSDLENSD